MSSTLLVSLFILLPLVIIIAVVYINSTNNRKKKKDELMKLYNEIISADNLKITEVLILSDKIFAVDPEKKVFVFLHNHDEPVYDIIHLEGMSGCKIEKKGTNISARVQGKAVTELHVNEVYLSFLSRDSVLTNVRVYSEILDGQQEYCALTKVGADWQHKLNEVIKS